MSYEDQIKEVEINIEDAKEMIALRDALNRLENNKDFRKIILDGYFKDEASRAVLLKADIHMQQDKDQKQLDNIITGIGFLRQYFGKIYAMASQAEMGLKNDEETREQLYAEQLNAGGLQ